MAYSCWKINTLTILFVMLFSLFVIPVYAQSQKEVSGISKGKLTQTWLSKDMQGLLPSLSVDSGQSVVDHLLEYAFQFKGRPYCRGSKGPSSFDCSGFTHYVFKKIALKLNASSAAQYLQGISVDKEDIRRGDLVFFKGRNSSSSRVGHVGLVSEVLPGGKFKFIHASCSKGICEESSDALYYAKRYVGARRVIESDHSSVLLQE
ncbi:C40 family peptidase [Coprobacter fastidiosus]|jgi:lipoprotein Spr|uniref:C40 family peptidase n=1 Tax=Coprobacter fastidiosus TaxID=1099853 RepID=UPI000240EAFA|nr:C40 family peptidase [Coprobacter fastidiosus]EHL86719.1 hypothetical protein HMPREF1033_01382 [Tannerella sp. 6_1_58FAA_CT1]